MLTNQVDLSKAKVGDVVTFADGTQDVITLVKNDEDYSSLTWEIGFKKYSGSVFTQDGYYWSCKSSHRKNIVSIESKNTDTCPFNSYQVNIPEGFEAEPYDKNSTSIVFRRKKKYRMKTVEEFIAEGYVLHTTDCTSELYKDCRSISLINIVTNQIRKYRYEKAYAKPIEFYTEVTE